MEFAIDVAAFRAALVAVESCMSPDIARPHLNGVRIEADAGVADGKGRIRMIATDGHRLAVWEGRADVATAGVTLVREDSVASVLAACKGRKMGEVRVSGSTATIVGPEGTTAVTLSLSDATFPPWQQVMPTTYAPSNLGVAQIGVSPVYLADACKAFAALHKALKAVGVNAGVTMDFGDDDLSPIVLSSEGSGLRILVMPMRLAGMVKGRAARWERGAKDAEAVRRSEREVRSEVRS